MRLEYRYKLPETGGKDSFGSLGSWVAISTIPRIRIPTGQLEPRPGASGDLDPGHVHVWGSYFLIFGYLTAAFFCLKYTHDG